MGLFKKAAKSAAVVGTAKVVVGAVSKRLAHRRQEKAAAPADEQQQSQPQGCPHRMGRRLRLRSRHPPPHHPPTRHWAGNSNNSRPSETRVCSARTSSPGRESPAARYMRRPGPRSPTAATDVSRTPETSPRIRPRHYCLRQPDDVP